MSYFCVNQILVHTYTYTLRITMCKKDLEILNIFRIFVLLEQKR